MKVKVNEATNVQLDWMVAKINGGTQKPTRCFDCRFYEERQGRDDAIQYCHHPKMDFEDGSGAFDTWASDYETHDKCPISDLTPAPVTTNRSQGGPIIEREGIRWNKDENSYYAWTPDHEWFDPLHEPMLTDDPGITWRGFAYGETLLIAAMRCYVMSRLGEVVEVPDDIA